MSPTTALPQSPSKTQPLAPRDPNTTSPSKPSPSKDQKRSENNEIADVKDLSQKTGVMGMSMEQHRQVLQSRLAAENGSAQPYISPSDTILSPCSAKLNAYKGKRFAKAKPHSLFSKKLQANVTPETTVAAAAAVPEIQVSATEKAQQEKEVETSSA